MAKIIKLKKGFDINIVGEADKTINTNFASRTFAISPSNFVGLSPIPKLLVEVGSEVKAGEPLFYDKKKPEIQFVSPVSGEVISIERGAKRAIARIVILADTINQYKKLDKIAINKANRKAIVDHLLATGCWPFFKQRPFNTIAEIDETPKNIFISAFSTGPLGIDYNYAIDGQGSVFQIGLDVLSKLTSGKVHLNLNAQATNNKAFTNAKNVQINEFKGKHPAGCVGIQIHHLEPINKGDVVWTIDPMDVVAIGRVFADGQYNTERLLAIAGPAIEKPQYVKSFLGANVANMLAANLNNDHVRVISGDVLTGDLIDKEGHVGFYDNLVTVLEEGDHYELFGWLIPSYARPSYSRTFPAFLTPNKKFKVNTNTHGEHRAFVVTGTYENVTPMDIYPMQLIKAVMYRDFEQMEGLGIYEVVEEDIALCEFICPSKTEFQEILREGLDYMREQS